VAEDEVTLFDPNDPKNKQAAKRQMFIGRIVLNPAP